MSNNNNNLQRNLWDWMLVRWVVGLAVFLFLILFLIYGIGEEGVRQNIRWSARISFSLFCLAFSASGIHSVFKQSWSWWLLMNRKYLGISFAIIHLIHLVFLFVLQYAYHPVFDLAARGSLVGGGIAYFFVVAMLVTSFERISTKISRMSWKILHTVGGYWIWSIYMTSYFKRGTTEPIHWILVAILVSVVIVRIVRIRLESKWI